MSLSNLFSPLVKIWQAEPARVISVVTSAVIFAATNFGFVVQETSVTTAVTLVLGILFSGEVIRSKVSPAAPSVKVTSTTVIKTP